MDIIQPTQPVPKARALGLNTLVPASSAKNAELKKLLMDYKKHCEQTNKPFTLYIQAFYYTLFNNESLGRPYDSGKIDFYSIMDKNSSEDEKKKLKEKLEKLNDDLKKTHKENSDALKNSLQSKEVDLENLQYNEKYIQDVADAYGELQNIKNLKKDIDDFYTWCDSLSPKPIFLDTELKENIKKNLVGGLCTNIAHPLIQENIYPFLGYFTTETLAVIEENLDALKKAKEALSAYPVIKSIKETVIKSIGEKKGFPVNMKNLKNFFSGDYPDNNDIEGQNFKDDALFVTGTKEALCKLEVDPNYIMMESSEKNKVIQNFISQLEKNRSITNTADWVVIKTEANKIGKSEGFLSRHLNGNTGIVKALEYVKLENQMHGVMKEFKLYIDELSEHGKSGKLRAKHIRKFLRQVEDVDSNPFWFVELMFYDSNLDVFNSRPISRLFQNEEIKKDFARLFDDDPEIIKKMLNALRSKAAEYVMKSLKMDKAQFHQYIENLKSLYIENPPQSLYGLISQSRSLNKDVVGRKTSIGEGKLSKEQLAGQIKEYVRTKNDTFSKELNNLGGILIFYNNLANRYNEIIRSMNPAKSEGKPRKLSSKEKEAFDKISKFMSKLYNKQNGIFDFYEIMISENNHKEKVKMNKMFQDFEQYFPNEMNNKIVKIPANKRFGVTPIDSLEVLWSSAKAQIIDHIAGKFPQQSKNEVVVAVNHLLDNKKQVKRDKGFKNPSPRATAEPAISSQSFSSASLQPSNTSTSHVSSSSSSLSSSYTSYTTGSSTPGKAMEVIGFHSKPLPSVSEKIKEIISKKDFPEKMITSCIDEYSEFINLLTAEKNIPANSELSKLSAANNAVDFFLILISSKMEAEMKTSHLFGAYYELYEALIKLTGIPSKIHVASAADSILASKQIQPLPSNLTSGFGPGSSSQ
jgi:hypothetical protein